MNKRIHGSLLVLSMASAVFASPASQAVAFKSLPGRIITFIKNCFTPRAVKTARIEKCTNFVVCCKDWCYSHCAWEYFHARCA